MLQQAFASRLSQQYEAIRRLSEMKLLAGGDPYKYVDDMRLLTESFNSLQVDANLVLQYFFWSGINTDMKREITHIANKNRPSLDEINANIFYAFVRYLASTKSKVKKFDFVKHADDNFQTTYHSTSVSSVNVEYNKSAEGENREKATYCSVCGGWGPKVTTHPTFKCTV